MDIEETNVNEEQVAETANEQVMAPVEAAEETPVETPAPEPEAVQAAAPEEVAATDEQQEAAPKPSKSQRMRELGRYYGTGHRKDATAKVWLTLGSGIFVVNDKPMADYLTRQALEILVKQPLVAVDLDGQVDIKAQCLGGGIAGQAGALRHGIAKALLELNPDYRPVLRRAGYLTRDPRVKERKKYGRRRARRAFQFTKR